MSIFPLDFWNDGDDAIEPCANTPLHTEQQLLGKSPAEQVTCLSQPSAKRVDVDTVLRQSVQSFIQGNHIARVSIARDEQITEFRLNLFWGIELLAYLNVYLFITLFSYKIDLLVTVHTSGPTVPTLLCKR